ncbi:MAG: MoaD/ThiS family protein [Janthinobacterium lividum]
MKLIRVMLPAAFSRHTAGTNQVQSEASNLPGLVDDLGAKFPELGAHIKDTDGTLRKFINVYVNDEDIRFLGGDAYQFQDRDEIMFIPSIAGGSR